MVYNPQRREDARVKRLTRGLATEVPGVDVYFGDKLDLSKTKNKKATVDGDSR
jgi:hypothetical protein